MQDQTEMHRVDSEAPALRTNSAFTQSGLIAMPSLSEILGVAVVDDFCRLHR